MGKKGQDYSKAPPAEAVDALRLRRHGSRRRSRHRNRRSRGRSSSLPILIAGIFIAAFLIGATFFASSSIQDRFAELERDGVHRNASQAQREIFGNIIPLVRQTQFSAYELLPQQILVNRKPPAQIKLLEKARTDLLGVDIVVLLDDKQELVSGLAAKRMSPQRMQIPENSELIKRLVKLAHSDAEKTFYTFHQWDGRTYILVGAPIVPWIRGRDAASIGTLVFGKALGPEENHLAETNQFECRFLDGAGWMPPMDAIELPALPKNSVSWDFSTSIKLAFSRTGGLPKSMSAMERLRDLQSKSQAGWLVNQFLADKTAFHLSLAFSQSKVFFAREQGASSHALVYCALPASNGPGTSAIMELKIPNELATAISSSIDTVRWVSIAGALLICGFTSLVLISMSRSAQARLALADSNQQKDRLLSIMAHDLRAPLAGVGNLAHIMKTAPGAFTKDEIQTYADEIHLTSKNLTELLENLLSWARLKTGRLAVSIALVDLPRLAGQVIKLYQPAAEAGALQLVDDYGGIASVRSDQEILRTILRNLVSNAIQHSPAGSMVTILFRDAEGDLEIHVMDEGPGMTPDQLEAIFEEAEEEQGPESTFTRAQESGSGFGLNLTRELVQVLGGTLSVESDGETGSDFCITFPHAVAEKCDTREIDSTADSAAKSSPPPNHQTPIST